VPVAAAPAARYHLRARHPLPPPIFSPTELEAPVLGVRIVASWADAELGRAAQDLLAKVEAVLPEPLRARLDTMPLLAPGDHAEVPRKVDLAALRRMIHERRKLDLDYCDAGGRLTRRRVWPLGLFFYGPVWLLAGWCELRQDFRMFRVDRMAAAAFLEATFVPTRGRTLEDFSRQEARRTQSADGTLAAAVR
jgi:predicted DNA-binding transcriptional regulator YafY